MSDLNSILRNLASPESQEKDSMQSFISSLMQGVGDPKNLPTSPQKLQGLAEPINMGAFTINPAAAMQDKVLTQGDGKSIPMSLSRSMTPIADAYPALNEAIMAGIPKKSEEPFNIIEDTRKNPIKYKVDKPKEESVEEIAPKSKRTSAKESAVEKTTAAAVEDKKEDVAQDRQPQSEDDKFKELAERYAIAREKASDIARDIQNNESASAITGIQRGNEGLKLRMQQELGKADDARTLMEVKRAEIKSGLDTEKALIELGDEKQKTNPNSAISEGSRSILKQMAAESGMKLTIPDGASYSQIVKLFPSVEQFLRAKEAGEARKEAQASRMMMMQLQNEEKKEGKIDAKFDKVHKMMVEDLASSRTVFGKNANIIRAADAVELLGAGKNLADINPQQFYEIAKSLDAMLSMGSPTITGTQKLMPRTALQDFASFKQYLSGKPQGMNTPEFVKSYMDLVKREKNLAKQKITSTKESMLYPILQYKDTHPAKVQQLLAATGLPLDILEKDSKKDSSSDDVDTSKSSSNKIKVSNGKEILMIDSADLKHAEADGYKRVD